MIRILLGTKAQLIKMAPILLELQHRRLPYDLVLTGQHHETMEDLLDVFAIPRPDMEIVSRMEANTRLKMVHWLGLLLWRSGFSMRKRLWQPKPGIVLVHGDTLSTLMGAIMAKMAGVPVAHVEAGLRSFNLLHPFPEELTRILVSQLADVFYCPGEWAANNLGKKKRGTIIDTQQNTLLDTLRLALSSPSDGVLSKQPCEPYGVVSVHRFENLSNQHRLGFVMETVLRTSKRIRLFFVLHPATRARLQSSPWQAQLDAAPGVTLMDRTDYIQFIQLLRRSRFIMTDGGSNQEEAAYMGLPCLLLRQATERQEGLEQNTLLAKYDSHIVDTFVDRHSGQEWTTLPFPQAEPSRIIVDHLARLLALVPSNPP
ncbi:MAG: Epimerase 2 protein [Magnetococcales bacterium]|nr:Epimerase 2 protein [Magnetococcales bacterium]HIJ85413.1 hypothetical protein [Magnetococcales bacterium]